MLEVMAQLAARNEKVYGHMSKVDTRNSTLRRLWKIRNPVSPGDAICGEPTVLDELDNDSGWNIRDDLCGYMGDISAFSLLSNVIRDGSGSMVQRKAFFDMFADENIDVYVWQFAANIIPTPAEYRRLESCLSQGDFPAVRMMLLLRTPTGLCRSVKNLIESKNAKSRRTGKTLLNIILKNNAVGYAKPIKEYLSKYN